MTPQADNRTDQQLIQECRNGDSGAFDILYQRHRDAVWRMAVRLTEHPDDAQDVFQEAFAYLLRRLPELTLTASLTTLLYPAIRNLAIAARRRRLRNPSTPDDDLLQIPAAVAPASVTSELTHALESLSDQHREVLILRFVDDLSVPEISLSLSIPEGTVKSRLHHAVQAIRNSHLRKKITEL